MRRCAMATLALLVLAAGHAAAKPADGPGSAPAQTTLRYKFKKGDRLDYALDQDMKMAMKAAGMDIDMTVTQQMEMAWDVLAVDEGGTAKIRMKMGRMKMAMKGGPMGNVEIDSAAEQQPEDALGKILAKVVGAVAGMEMTFTMTAAGEMKDVQVPEKTLAAFKGMPGAEQMGDMFTPEGMKRMVQGNMSLPKDPVKKGDAWTQKTDMKLPFGKTTGDVKYTYEGPADKDGKQLEKIAMRPELKIEPDPNAPFKLTTKDQKGAGVIYFDNKAGRVASMTNEMTMTMDLEVGGQTITQRIVQNTTMRLAPPSSKK